MVKCYINGEIRELKQAIPLNGLLELLEIHPKSVVVEYNEKVVASSLFGQVMVDDGDKVEIVRFVGGGL